MHKKFGNKNTGGHVPANRHVPDRRAEQASSAGSPPNLRALRANADSYLLWGQHVVGAALANPERRIRQIYTTPHSHPKSLDMIATLPRARQAELPEPILAHKNQFDALSGSMSSNDGGKALHQQFVLEVLPLEAPDLTDCLYPNGPMRLLVLDQVTDPRNIGAMLRSAQAFGVQAVVMTKKHAPDEGGVLARAAAGALEHVPMIQVTNLARALEMMADANVHLAGLDAAGDRALETLVDEPRLAIIMGSEGDGMRRLTREACHSLVAIAMADTTESLNVSVAASIALYASRAPNLP